MAFFLLLLPAGRVTVGRGWGDAREGGGSTPGWVQAFTHEPDRLSTTLSFDTPPFSPCSQKMVFSPLEYGCCE